MTGPHCTPFWAISIQWTGLGTAMWDWTGLTEVAIIQVAYTLLHYSILASHKQNSG